MSDIYFLQVSGGSFEEMAEALVDKANEQDLASDDNLIIVPEEIKPLNREEGIEYLERMADALDVEVSEDGSS